jgi:hypothetical protein
LSRSTVFSGIDSIGAFHVIELEDKDKAKTAFATPWGSYQFVRMPFGLAGGPSSYARLVHMVLDGIPYTQALPYLDDTVIHSKDLAGHFLALDRVLEAYEKAGLKLQPAKCQLFQREIEYLGYMVSAKGIAPVPGYVQVVKDLPMPTNRSEVRTFLGKTGYYRRFMENYAEVAGPLTDILKQDGTDDRALFDQTSLRMKSFEQLKSNLLHAPILAYPMFDSERPFILDTDWSQENRAVGAVLSQFQNGKERVIAYGASKLTVAQSAYHSTKGEMAAAICYIRKWKNYLQHRRFILRIDNAAMQRDIHDGMLVWNTKIQRCQDRMSLMYQGRAKLHQARSTSNAQDDLEEAIILVAQNETKRYAGLVLEGTRSMCGHVCHNTQIPDVVVCMDTKDPNKDWKFQKSIDHEEVNLLTHMHFLHLSRGLGNFRRFKEFQEVVCQVERKSLFNANDGALHDHALRLQRDPEDNRVTEREGIRVVAARRPLGSHIQSPPPPYNSGEEHHGLQQGASRASSPDVNEWVSTWEDITSPSTARRNRIQPRRNKNAGRGRRR